MNNQEMFPNKLCPAQKRAGSHAEAIQNSKLTKDPKLGRKCVSQNASEGLANLNCLNSPR